jgi:hypothetical protein
MKRKAPEDPERVLEMKTFRRSDEDEPVISYPYTVIDDDHCETPLEA